MGTTPCARPSGLFTCTNKFRLAGDAEDVVMEANEAMVVLTPFHSGDDSGVFR